MIMSSLFGSVLEWITCQPRLSRLPPVVGDAPAVPCQRIVVLINKPNPTYDYYLRERLDMIDSVPVHLCRLNHSDFETISLEGAFVIICRYIKAAYVRRLEKERDKLAGLALFIDDDIQAVLKEPDAPLGYKLFAAYRGLWPVRRLNPLLTAIWTSTGALAEGFGGIESGITLVPPYPPHDLSHPGEKAIDKPAQSDRIRIAYHATKTHRAGHVFLKPVIQEIMARHTHVDVEIFSHRKTTALWRDNALDQERLFIRPMISWADYQVHCRSQPADLILVPLIDSLANRVRSDTKRIDVVRLGAAAVFSSAEPYLRCRMEGEVFVENDPSLWIDAIDTLIRNQERRLDAARATRASLDLMRSLTSAALPIPGLNPSAHS